MNPFQGAAGRSGMGHSSGDIIPTGYTKGQLKQFTPEQQNLFQSMFGNVGPDSFLSQIAGGNEEAFQQYEAPAWRNFQQAQGQLGARFSQLAPGAMSAQKSSGFQNAAGQQASSFAEQLASNRMGLQRQALMDLYELSQMLLNQRPYQKFLAEEPYEDEGPSFLQSLLGAAGTAGGAFLGSFAGPAGTAFGASMGSNFGNMFGGGMKSGSISNR